MRPSAETTVAEVSSEAADASVKDGVIASEVSGTLATNGAELALSIKGGLPPSWSSILLEDSNTILLEFVEIVKVHKLREKSTKKAVGRFSNRIRVVFMLVKR